MQAILAAPNQAAGSGRRELRTAPLSLQHRRSSAGAGGHRAADLQLGRPPQALLRGKGKKERICPLWATTALTLRRLLAESGMQSESGDKIFRNAQGEPLTRFGVD